MKIMFVGDYIVLLDEKDYVKVKDYKWEISHKYGPAVPIGRTETGGSISMHRLIMGLKKDDTGAVKHLNGCKMDNRKENLEVFDKTAGKPKVNWTLHPKKKPSNNLLDIDRCVVPNNSGKYDVYSYAAMNKQFLGEFSSRADAIDAHNDFVVSSYGNKYSTLADD